MSFPNSHQQKELYSIKLFFLLAFLFPQIYQSTLTLIYAHNLDRIAKAPELKIDALLGDTRNVNNVYNVNTKMETA